MRIQVGGVCPRGGGHVWTYDPSGDLEAAGACGGKSWPMFIHVDETDPEDMEGLPDWLRKIADEGGLVT